MPPSRLYAATGPLSMHPALTVQLHTAVARCTPIGRTSGREVDREHLACRVLVRVHTKREA